MLKSIVVKILVYTVLYSEKSKLSFNNNNNDIILLSMKILNFRLNILSNCFFIVFNHIMFNYILLL